MSVCLCVCEELTTELHHIPCPSQFEELTCVCEDIYIYIYIYIYITFRVPVSFEDLTRDWDTEYDATVATGGEDRN